MNASPTQQVRIAIQAADVALVGRHPWLGRSDAVASGIFLGTVALIGGAVAAWSLGWLHTLPTIVALAFLSSVLHEMEHDLIHDLYLRQPAVRKLVLLVIWLAKASLDPWKRGRLHLRHHVVSGQDEDVEERLIGLGLPWGLRRVVITLLPPVALVMLPDLRDAFRDRSGTGGHRSSPHSLEWSLLLEPINVLLLCLPLIGLIGLLMGASWAWPLLVLWALPNVLRHISIVIMSSSCHYVGIQRGVLMEQNQILDHWVFWPLQAFCWNFGATHVVHHFFVRQPFWRRTLVFPSVREVMVESGVRANDLGSFTRANRYAA